MSLKVLIVEDEFPIALDFETRIRQIGYDTCGIASNYNDAKNMINHQSPDLILLDINLNDKHTGIDLAKYINENIHIPFIYTTAYSDDYTFSSALETKPIAFLNKPFTNKELYHAIEVGLKRFEVLKKTTQEFSKQLKLMEKKVNEIEERKKELPEYVGKLSKREIEVLIHLSEGLTDEELSDRLFVSITTIRTHLRKIYSKLLVKNRTEAVAFLNKYSI